VPRVPDEWLNSVVYLYPSKKDAERGAQLGGTAFIVVLPSDDKSLPEQLGHYYVVTNDHVVEDLPEVWARINRRSGGSEPFQIPKAQWANHPDGDDLAAAYVRPDSEYKYIGVNRSMILTPDLQARLEFGPGDEIFFIGRYVDLEGKAHNVPTVREGILSAYPAEPVLNRERNRRQESILVEARSFSGFSGSPVFVTRAPRIQRSDDFDGAPVVVRTSGVEPCYLLGVNWGHYHWHEKVRDPKTHKPLTGHTYVQTNSGMMMVVPAEKLLELLDDPRLVKPRREMEIKEKKLRA
jgi:hypothetical protein